MLVTRIQQLSAVHTRYTLVWAAQSPGPAARPAPLTERSQMAAGREEEEEEVTCRGQHPHEGGTLPRT